MQCSACGKELQPTDKFCPYCGKENDITSNSDDMKTAPPVCPHCGKEVQTSDNFCPYCGQNCNEGVITNSPLTNIDEPVSSASLNCPHCGKKINLDDNFCPYCGQTTEFEQKFTETTPDEATINMQQKDFSHSNGQTDMASNKKINRNYFIVAGIAGIVILAIIVAVYSVGGGSKYINMVKNSNWHDSDMTIGDAFDKFFSDCEWKTKDIDGYHYVYFSGECEDENDGGKSIMHMKFRIDDNEDEFRLINLSVDGVNYTYRGNTIITQICNGKKHIRW